MKFENIKIEENENFYDFYPKFNEIMYLCQCLKEKILEYKLVIKILRAFPERFKAKIIAIKESKYIQIVKIDELVGSYKTYKINFSPPKNGGKV